jgi:hypothetical protein
MSDVGRIQLDHTHRLDDLQRLETQVSEQDLARLLALRGDEDVLDLGSFMFAVVARRKDTPPR